MDPITAISLGVTAASGIMGGLSSRSQYKYQQGIAQLNAKINEQNAAYQRQVGEIQAQRVGMEGAQRMGQIRATQGASNLDVNRGSQAGVQASQHAIILQDQATTRANAADRAYGYEVKKTQDVAQAGMYGAAARYALPASIIGTAGSVASRWMQAASVGAAPGGSGAGGWAGGMGLDLYGTGGLY